MDQRINQGERNDSTQTATGGLRKDVGDFAHDILTLAELQAQLLIADLQEGNQSARIPCILLLSGTMFGMAGASIALVAVALFIIETYQVSYPIGFLIAATVGAILSGTLVAIGLHGLRKCFQVLHRSRTELTRNLNWMKNLLSPNRLARNHVNDRHLRKT
jgi:hypothetical protein